MYQSRITLKQCRKPKSSFQTALCRANGSTMKIKADPIMGTKTFV